jgi:hypothetical protein
VATGVHPAGGRAVQMEISWIAATANPRRVPALTRHQPRGGDAAGSAPGRRRAGSGVPDVPGAGRSADRDVAAGGDGAPRRDGEGRRCRTSEARTGGVAERAVGRMDPRTVVLGVRLDVRARLRPRRRFALDGGIRPRRGRRQRELQRREQSEEQPGDGRATSHKPLCSRESAVELNSPRPRRTISGATQTSQSSLCPARGGRVGRPLRFAMRRSRRHVPPTIGVASLSRR